MEKVCKGPSNPKGLFVSVKLSPFICSTAILLILIFFSPAHLVSGERSKVGIAFSGGGAKGFAHIGVLKVLEEENIPIDYISGVSMGAIVGGLYAIGYNSDELIELVKSESWLDMMQDRIDRRAISLDERKDYQRYIASFPIKGAHIEIPTGLSAGQNVGRYLSRITWPVHHLSDFNNFPIPFRAIATDILTGEAVILDHGYLAGALQASMAVPSLFIPVEVNGHYCVDGGVVRNFPVSDARDMGADIVIGVDVTAPLYKRDELISGIKVVDQSISLAGFQSTQYQKTLANILISPDVFDYIDSDYSLDDIDTLIHRGEIAAREALPNLKLLLGENYPQSSNRNHPIFSIDSVFVSEIEIEGLKKVNKNLILGKLQLKTPRWVHLNQLEMAIDRVYGSAYFHQVNYHLVPLSGNRVRLVIRVVERSNDTFNVAFHYDDYNNASLLLNLMYRNIWKSSSRFHLDMILGENPGLTTQYFIHTAWTPGIGIGVRYIYREFDLYQYQDGRRISQYENDYSTVNLTLLSSIFNSLAISTIISQDFTTINPVVTPNEESSFRIKSLNITPMIMLDTFDDAFFPTKGLRINFQWRYTRDIVSADSTVHYPNYNKFTLILENAFSISDRVVLIRRLTYGKITKDGVPEMYRFYVGGLAQRYDPLNSFFSFAGLNMMEKSGNSTLVANAELHIELWKNNYLTLRGDWGNLSDDPQVLFAFSEYMLGGAIGFKYNSVIGPVSIDLMHSNIRKDHQVYISIGYPF